MKRLIPIEDIKRLSVKTVALFLISSYKLIQITCFSVTIQQVVFLYTQWIKSTVKSFNN